MAQRLGGGAAGWSVLPAIPDDILGDVIEAERAGALTHGEKWFRKQIETWRGLGGADISEDGHSETVCFRIGEENNPDSFMELLLAVAVNLRGISAELSNAPMIQSEA